MNKKSNERMNIMGYFPEDENEKRIAKTTILQSLRLV